ncbi:MAG: hypothetical protein Q4E41_01050 [Bacteroidales bacterium]|nr:hypothetical protein [Bacteroidales bacterium]
MNEIYDNNMMELEEMRGQLNLLKQKLSEQEIVSEKLMRKVTSERLSKINNEGRIAVAVAAIFAPLNVFIFQDLGLSTAFIIVSTVYFLVCAGFSLYSRRGINPDDVIYGNLVETHRKMVRYKTLCNRWLMGVIPFLALWFGWLMYELYKQGQEMYRESMLGACIGLAIGSICGIIYYNKSKKNLNDAIQEINDLTKE